MNNMKKMLALVLCFAALTAVSGCGKQKAASIDDLDMAIEGAVKTALANLAPEAPESAAYAPAPSSNDEPQYVYVVPAEGSGNGEDPNDKFAHKRPTRNYVSYGLGMAMWHNYDFTYRNKDGKTCKELGDFDKDLEKRCHEDYDTEMTWEQAFVFHYARIFEVIPQAAITIVNNMNMSFGDEWQWHETFLIGGRWFPSTGTITPFLGAGLGLGIQIDGHYYDEEEGFAIGLATGAELGVIFFRNSATQLEVGFAWDALWDGFEAFDRRFGAGSFYIAIVVHLLAVHFLDELAAHGLGVALSENGGTYDEHVRARFLAGEDIVELDAAVNLDVQFRLELTQGADLVEAVRDQALAAETGVHRHDEDHVHDVEDVFDALEGRCRVDGDCGFHAEFGNLVEQAVEVVRRFGVDANDGGARLCEFGDVVFRIRNHQVAIQRQAGSLLDAGGNARTETDVRYEVAVHDVEVDKARATVFDGLEALAEFKEVRVQYAGCDNLLQHATNLVKRAVFRVKAVRRGMDNSSPVP